MSCLFSWILFPVIDYENKALFYKTINDVCWTNPHSGGFQSTREYGLGIYISYITTME